MTDKKQYLDLIPQRVKYYLLEWKDKNMDKFIIMFGEKRLRDLDFKQLRSLFDYAVITDSSILFDLEKTSQP
jgi:hypothetical protein